MSEAHRDIRKGGIKTQRVQPTFVSCTRWFCMLLFLCFCCYRFILPNSYAVTRYRMTATIVEVSPINASKGISFMRFLMSM